MFPQTYNLIWVQGDTGARKTVTLVNWPTTSIEGAIIKAQLKRTERQQLTVVADIPCTILSPTDRRILLTLPGNVPPTHRPSQITPDLRASKSGGTVIEFLPRDEIPGRPYFWDLQIDTGGGVVTYLQGCAIVLSEATNNV
jgi:hypothetical protein